MVPVYPLAGKGAGRVESGMAGNTSPMDAITQLKNDHKTVEKLSKRFEKAEKADDDDTKAEVVDQIIQELSVHAAIEEQVFYPAVREAVPETEDTVLEGLEEHHIVKWTLTELEDMTPDEERFDAKVTVLIESVRHHVEEEEGELFPEVRKALGRKRLGEIGEKLAEAKETVPARPQPEAPDTLPGNVTTTKATTTKAATKKGAPKRAASKKKKA